MPYNARNMTNSAHRHVHEGDVEVMPGEETVIPKAKVLSKFKDATFEARKDQMLPGFGLNGVTINGEKAGDVSTQVAKALASGDVKIRNGGTEKALVAVRMTVTEVVEAKKPPSPPPVQESEIGQ